MSATHYDMLLQPPSLEGGVIICLDILIVYLLYRSAYYERATANLVAVLEDPTSRKGMEETAGELAPLLHGTDQGDSNDLEVGRPLNLNRLPSGGSPGDIYDLPEGPTYRFLATTADGAMLYAGLKDRKFTWYNKHGEFEGWLDISNPMDPKMHHMRKHLLHEIKCTDPYDITLYSTAGPSSVYASIIDGVFTWYDKKSRRAGSLDFTSPYAPRLDACSFPGYE